MQGLAWKGGVGGWKTRGLLITVPSTSFPQTRRLVFTLRKDSTGHGAGMSGASKRNTYGQSSSQGNKYFLPGATIATLCMLGGLHARRLYDDQKSEQARQQNIEPEFEPDFKAAFLQFLPLRSISRVFGMLTSLELPVWSRSYIYRGFCRAFHANVDEVEGKLEDYESLQKFFVRELKLGCRPVDSNPCSMVSPVDGVMLRYGQIKGSGLAIEQVKGHSYSLRALLGGEPQGLPRSTYVNIEALDGGVKSPANELHESSLFYCVLYLGPGDYHRVHSPVDWRVLWRRHLSGRLFPVNERATRTIKSLYVGNERVVLEGVWENGYMALVAVGATNIGSIELKMEPNLKTNCQKLFAPNSSLVSCQKYGAGFFLRKGNEVAAFNLGSTVVLMFQAPVAEWKEHGDGQGFKFCVQKGQRIQMGQAIGKW